MVLEVKNPSQNQSKINPKTDAKIDAEKVSKMTPKLTKNEAKIDLKFLFFPKAPSGAGFLFRFLSGSGG